MSYQRHLINDKRFWPIFWTQFLGAFNDNLFKNALVILIAYKSFSLLNLGKEQMVSLCAGIFILPFFLFSSLAGQISDKFSKSKLTTIIKISEVGIMALGSIGFYFNVIELLLSALFLMGLQSTFFGPIKYSILPDLIESDELIHGNALVEMGTFVSILLGTILGGVLIGIEKMEPVYLAIATISFAVLGVYTSLKVKKIKPSNSDLKIDYNIFRSTWDILKISKKVKSVYLSILGISWFWFIGAALLSIFPIYVKETLHSSEEVVTLFLALFSIGVAVGSMICEKLSKERLELGLVPFGSIGITIFLMDLFIVGKPDLRIVSGTYLGLKEFLSHPISYRIIFDLFMLSLSSGFFIVPLYTFIQQRSDKEGLSRVIAGNNILNALFMVGSSIILAVLYALKLSSSQIILVLGLCNAVVAIYIYTVIPEFLWRFCCLLITRLIYRVKATGLENIPEEGPAVVTCNHVTFVDWLILSASVKRPMRFVMHYSFMKIPFFSFMLRGAKVIPIAGTFENKEILTKAFDQIAQNLESGEIVCIFPEGEITRDGQMNTFKKGIEKIIERTPVPVIPMAMTGLWGSFFSRKYNGRGMSNPMVIFKTLWSKIRLKIDHPIGPKEVTAQKLESVTHDLMKSDI